MASPDEPMAFADEGAPAPHKKSPGHKASTPPISSQLDYEEADNRPVGPSFQATSIPAYMPRPAQPTAREAKFLQAALLCAPGQPGVAATTAAAAAVFKARYMAMPDGAGRWALLGAAVAELDAKMGPGMVQVRGILCLGLLGCLLSWLLGVCQLLYHCHFFCH